MFCRNCDTQNPVDYSFCSNCGESLPSSYDSEIHRSPTIDFPAAEVETVIRPPAPKKWLSVGGVAVVCVLAAMMVIFAGGAMLLLGDRASAKLPSNNSPQTQPTVIDERPTIDYRPPATNRQPKERPSPKMPANTRPIYPPINANRSYPPNARAICKDGQISTWQGDRFATCSFHGGVDVWLTDK